MDPSIAQGLESSPCEPLTASLRPVGRRRNTGAGLRLASCLMLWLWAALAVAAVSTLMAGHWLMLPSPASAERPDVAAALVSLRAEGDDRWFAVHVMYVDCRCSQRVVDHLTTRQRPPELSEHVVLVGRDRSMERRLQTRGYRVTTVNPEELLSRFRLQAAPLLAVISPAGDLRYLGGYSERKQGPDIRDLEIVAGLRARSAVDELPLFGCAVSQGLQDLLDPLGIKYNRTP